MGLKISGCGDVKGVTWMRRQNGEQRRCLAAHQVSLYVVVAFWSLLVWVETRNYEPLLSLFAVQKVIIPLQQVGNTCPPCLSGIHGCVCVTVCCWPARSLDTRHINPNPRSVVTQFWHIVPGFPVMKLNSPHCATASRPPKMFPTATSRTTLSNIYARV